MRITHTFNGVVYTFTYPVTRRWSAQAVALIVVRGDRESGFSCQVMEDIILDLPAVLRSVADQIEANVFKEVVTDFKGWLQPDD